MKNYLASAIGVKIEGALRKDLQDAKLIYYVTDTLETNYNIISLTENNRCQYLIYSAPEIEKIQLGELYCYGEASVIAMSTKPILQGFHNDDNYIRGDKYELFYHGGVDGWISLGKKEAEEIELLYKNVPGNNLLWLHNETRGREEQVFYSKNRKQVFAYEL